jgi:hypothetical protein
VREAAKADTNGGGDDVKPKRVNGSTVVFPSTFRGPGLAGSIAATFRVPVSDHSVAQVVSDLLLFAQNWKVACELLADAEKPAS